MVPSDKTTRSTEPAKLGATFPEEGNRSGFQNAMWYDNLSKQHHNISPTQLFNLRKTPHVLDKIIQKLKHVALLYKHKVVLDWWCEFLSV